MKQHITRKQLKELSDDGYIKLYAWNKVKRNISTISTVCPHPRFRKEPLLSIGKMIEFLVDNKTNWFVTDLFSNLTFRVDGEEFIKSPNLLCDSLWQAVKEVLNDKEMK